MKAILVSLTVLMSVQAMAAERMYLVEPMKCVSTLTSKNKGMAKGYEKENMTFTSMKSTRRDGSLASVLEIERDFASNGYMSPLFISDDGVIKKEIGSYDETIVLKVVKSEVVNGQRIDTLKGTMSAKGTVVGNTTHSLDCKAVVVNKVKRVDDFTARR